MLSEKPITNNHPHRFCCKWFFKVDMLASPYQLSIGKFFKNGDFLGGKIAWRVMTFWFCIFCSENHLVKMSIFKFRGFKGTWKQKKTLSSFVSIFNHFCGVKSEQAFGKSTRGGGGHCCVISSVCVFCFGRSGNSVFLSGIGLLLFLGYAPSPQCQSTGLEN